MATNTILANFFDSNFYDILFLRNYNTRIVALAAILLGSSSGALGCFLLLRKRSLLGDTLSHATLPGIAFSFIILYNLGLNTKSLPSLLLGAIISGLAGVFFVFLISKYSRLKDEAAMGLVLSVMFGLGISLLGIVQSLPGASAAGLSRFIYGKTASIVIGDLRVIIILASISIVLLILFKKELTALCFDAAFAKTQNLPTNLLDLLLMGLICLITVAGLQAVGLILVIAFLITPASAARFWTNDLGKMLLIAGIIGAFGAWLGAFISALLPKMPAGAVMVLAMAVMFLASMLFAPLRGILPRWRRFITLKKKIHHQHLLRAVYEILENIAQKNKKQLRNSWIDVTQLLNKRSWKKNFLFAIIKRVVKNGYLETNADKIRLSESGFGEAARITRNHRLWEEYLIKYADIAPSHVDRNADLVEHILAPDLVSELEAVLRQRGDWIKIPQSRHVIDEKQ